MVSGRRGLIRWMLGGGLSASAVSFIYPVLKYVMPPPAAEAAVTEAPAGKTQDLKPNTAKVVKFGSRPVLLIRVSEAEWKAFSGVCTHLNCTVQYHEARRQIWCACHNGFYDLNGRVVSGPPPNPLEELTVRVRGDELVVSRRA
jgi:cytochrome b6-f complex iron-sulfur subunit